MLCFLRGPPFEPLSSCSLRDLTQKVLFLVSLATARWVGELQAVSRDVSFSGSDIYLSYLPEFRAKTESLVNPLPRSFCVRSLADFVGDLPAELLCPVRALRVYLSRVSSVSPRPRFLFVSPRSPTRSLSKNALSFFLRDIISHAYSSSHSGAPSTSSASSFRAHSVRGVAASWAFSRNAPLSLLLLPGLLRLFLLPFTSLMSSFLLPRVLVWALWWLLVLWYRFVFLVLCHWVCLLGFGYG